MMHIREYLDYILHADAHRSQEMYWKDCAEQYSQEAEAAEDSCSDLYARYCALERKNSLLHSALCKLLSTVSGTLSAYVTAERLYYAVSEALDPDGTMRYQEAEKMWGRFNYDAHWSQLVSCFYDDATDHDMFRYLLEDVKETIGSDPELECQLAQVYRNTFVRLDLLAPGFYVEPFHKPLPLICIEDLSKVQIKALYDQYARTLDAAGFLLFHEAEDILGGFEETNFPYEANHGVFEVADGRKLLQYLLVQHQSKLGNHNFDRWTFPLEECVDLSIDTSTEEYEHFEETLYRRTCMKLGLLYRKADLENELELRKQNICVSSPLEAYTEEEIRTVLNSRTLASSAG